MVYIPFIYRLLVFDTVMHTEAERDYSLVDGAATPKQEESGMKEISLRENKMETEFQ